MHRVVCRSQYPHGDEGIAQYLDALDWVLDDGVIDRAERAAMDGLAMEWGISPARQHQAHREYLDCMVEAARRDGFVSEAEHEILLRIATQLQGRHRNRSRAGHPQLHYGTVAGDAYLFHGSGRSWRPGMDASRSAGASPGERMDTGPTRDEEKL